MKQYYVYILASYRGVLYIGVTNDLMRRVYEHKNKIAHSFTAKYNTSKLVYFESTDDVSAAIEREKQIKRWVRRRKVELIETLNPYWRDLSEEWYETSPTTPDPSLHSG